MASKIPKNHEKEILEKINTDKYEISWNEEGVPYKFKEKTKIKKGKSSKAKGVRFELKVRRDLEEKGFIVTKWSNNVDLEKSEMTIAKRKYNPFSKAMTVGTGFPDFIAFKKVYGDCYNVLGVEVKLNGSLSKEEKEKCRWYLEKGIFPAIWIARAKKEGRKIIVEYIDFKERYG